MKYQHKAGLIDDPTCRYCGAAPETAAHIVSGCPCFSFNRYLHRHDQVARAIYWTILGHLGAPRNPHWWRQRCPPHFFYQGHHLRWNQSHLCPELGSANKPDLLWARPDGTVKVIEVSVPRDGRVAIVRSEKREKYVALMNHLRRQYRGWVDFVPAVIGATGAVARETAVALKRLEIELEIPWLQTIAARSTANLFRHLL